MKKLLLALGFLLLAGASLPAFAQTSASQTVPGYYANAPQTNCPTGPCFIPYGSTLPVTASIAGFAPSGTVASLSGATSSSSVALPAGSVVSVTNTGSNTLFYNLSVGAGTAATTDAALVAGASVGLTVGGNTFFNGITSTSTTTARLAGGTGLVTGYGGGSSSGGGGSSASVGANGATAPTSSDQVGYKDASGNLQPASAATPLTVVNVPISYTLLSNASSTGTAVLPYGGNYLLGLSGTFGGTTVTLTSTINSVTTTLGTYTASPATAPCFLVTTGTSIQAVVTGGSPSGLYATLGGGGSGGCSGSVTTIAQATPVSASALAANQIVVASAAKLVSFEVAADSTLSGAAWWIMIYNATSAPADGAVTPAKCYALPSGSTGFNGAFNSPVNFTTGIVIGVSTTGCFTKTASTHAFISGDYQ